MKKLTPEHLDRAFNQGCQARLDGHGITRNPYFPGRQADKWIQGWLHVNSSWGKDSRRAVPALPQVGVPS